MESRTSSCQADAKVGGDKLQERIQRSPSARRSEEEEGAECSWSSEDVSAQPQRSVKAQCVPQPWTRCDQKLKVGRRTEGGDHGAGQRQGRDPEGDPPQNLGKNFIPPPPMTEDERKGCGRQFENK
ncbi:uncharacterized protein WM294_013118 isoform 2-T2 [Sarcoramphus papa]